MSDSGSSQGRPDPPRGAVIGEVQPFDPGPSVAAAAAALAAQGAEFALINGLALNAWGMPRATKDVHFAVPVGAAEKAADSVRGPDTEIRPLRIGGVGVRDSGRGLRIDFVDCRFHFRGLFEEAIRDAVVTGRRARIGGHEVALVALEYLLAMKLVSGEPKDEIDARRLLQREELRYLDARRIIEQHLGAASANRLDALARDAGRPEVARPALYRNGEEESE